MTLRELQSLAESVDTARRIQIRVASNLRHDLLTSRAAKLAQDAVDTCSELLSDLQSRIDLADVIARHDASAKERGLNP